MPERNDTSTALTVLDPPLNARELAIAKHAAQIAIQELTDNFYKQVGKTMVTRALVWIGAFALGLGWAKGWITFTPPK